jgi:hypothetical protein
MFFQSPRETVIFIRPEILSLVMFGFFVLFSLFALYFIFLHCISLFGTVLGKKLHFS